MHMNPHLSIMPMRLCNKQLLFQALSYGQHFAARVPLPAAAPLVIIVSYRGPGLLLIGADARRSILVLGLWL